MDQKSVLFSALGVGVGLGVGIGLTQGQTVQKWVGGKGESRELTGELIEKELKRQVIDGKSSNVTLEDFPYFLSERTRALLTSAAYVHLKQHHFSKHTRNLSPASQVILLSGPAEFYQQMLAKALANYFESKLLLLDFADFSRLMQSKYGCVKRESTFKRSLSELTLERMSSLFGSLPIPSLSDNKGTSRRQVKGGEASDNPPKLRRNASSSTDINSISSYSGSTTSGYAGTYYC